MSRTAAPKAKRPVGRPPKIETRIARAVAAAIQDPKASTRKITAKYDAAGMGRRMAGWNPPSSGPNRAIEGLQRIRNRARDSSRNDWSGESGVQKWTTNLIGIGITPRFNRIKSKLRKRQITDIWNDFVKQADADGVNNLYGLQTLVVRTWLDGGEAFVRRRPRFPDEGFTVPLQIQVLEAEMVPLLDAISYPGLPQGNEIRSGVEFNKRGRRIAYWVYKVHPGDGQLTYTSNDLVRVLASDMCHVFEQKRPGQIRGVSMLAPVLARLRNIENYDDATLTRQQLANLVVGFITRKLPVLSEDDDIDPLTNLPVADEGPLGPLMGLQPGLMQELADGEDVKWSNPPEAGTDYPAYMRTQHMGTAAAAGLPYEVFAGDIANVSDRTLRVLINEFRRFAEQRQWQHVIPQFCQPVVEWAASAMQLVDLVTIEEAQDVARAEHAPHGWAYIHPVQDPQGKALEVTNNFRSRSSVIGERGDDPDLVDEEIQADDKRQQTLKTGPYSKAAADAQKAKAAAKSADAGAPPAGADKKEQQAQARAKAKAKAKARADAKAAIAKAMKEFDLV
jgi:lambda family phage portal protein